MRSNIFRKATFYHAIVLALSTSLTPVRAMGPGDIQPSLAQVKADINGHFRTGTAFIVSIIDDTAYLLTATHVVEGASAVFISFAILKDETLPARIIAMEESEGNDLALLEVSKAPAGLQSVEFDETQIVLGDDAFLAGFTLEGRNLSIRKGVFSGSQGSRLLFDMIADEGNSGGPILHRNGNVIGMATGVQELVRAVPAEIMTLILENWLKDSQIKALSNVCRPSRSKISPQKFLGVENRGLLNRRQVLRVQILDPPPNLDAAKHRRVVFAFAERGERPNLEASLPSESNLSSQLISSPEIAPALEGLATESIAAWTADIGFYSVCLPPRDLVSVKIQSLEIDPVTSLRQAIRGIRHGADLVVAVYIADLSLKRLIYYEGDQEDEKIDQAQEESTIEDETEIQEGDERKVAEDRNYNLRNVRYVQIEVFATYRFFAADMHDNRLAASGAKKLEARFTLPLRHEQIELPPPFKGHHRSFISDFNDPDLFRDEESTWLLDNLSIASRLRELQASTVRSFVGRFGPDRVAYDFRLLKKVVGRKDKKLRRSLSACNDLVKEASTYKQYQLKRGIVCLETVLERYPRSAAAYYNLGILHLGLFELDDAQSNLEKAAGLGEKNRTIKRNLEKFLTARAKLLRMKGHLRARNSGLEVLQ